MEPAIDRTALLSALEGISSTAQADHGELTATAQQLFGSFFDAIDPCTSLLMTFQALLFAPSLTTHAVFHRFTLTLQEKKHLVDSHFVSLLLTQFIFDIRKKRLSVTSNSDQETLSTVLSNTQTIITGMIAYLHPAHPISVSILAAMSSQINGNVFPLPPGFLQNPEHLPETLVPNASTDSFPPIEQPSHHFSWESIIAGFNTPTFFIQNRFEFEYLHFFLRTLHATQCRFNDTQPIAMPAFPIASLLTINNHTSGHIFTDPFELDHSVPPSTRPLPHLNIWKNTYAQVSLIDGMIASSLASKSTIPQFTSLKLVDTAEEINNQTPNFESTTYSFVGGHVICGHTFSIIKQDTDANTHQNADKHNEKEQPHVGIVDLYRTLLAILHAPTFPSISNPLSTHTSAVILNMLKQAALQSPFYTIYSILFSQFSPVKDTQRKHIESLALASALPLSTYFNSLQGTFIADTFTLVFTYPILTALQSPLFANDTRTYLSTLPNWMVNFTDFLSPLITPVFSLFPEAMAIIMLQMLYTLPLSTPPPPSLIPPTLVPSNVLLFVPSPASALFASLLFHQPFLDTLLQQTPSKHTIFFILIIVSVSCMPYFSSPQPRHIIPSLRSTTIRGFFTTSLQRLFTFEQDSHFGLFDQFINSALTVIKDRIVPFLVVPYSTPPDDEDVTSWIVQNESEIIAFDAGNILDDFPPLRDDNPQLTLAVDSLTFDVCMCNISEDTDLGFPFCPMLHGKAVKWLLQLICRCYQWLPETTAEEFTVSLQPFFNLNKHPLLHTPPELVTHVKAGKAERDAYFKEHPSPFPEQPLNDISMPLFLPPDTEPPLASAFPLPPTPSSHSHYSLHIPPSPPGIHISLDVPDPRPNDPPNSNRNWQFDTEPAEVTAFDSIPEAVLAEAEGLIASYFNDQRSAEDFARLLAKWKGTDETGPIRASDSSLPINPNSPASRHQTYALIIQQLLNELNFILTYADANMRRLADLFGHLLLEGSLSTKDQDYLLSRVLDMLAKPVTEKEFHFGYGIMQRMLPKIMDFPHFCVRLVQLETVKSVQPSFIQSIEERLTRCSNRIAQEAQKYAQDHLDKLQEAKKYPQHTTNPTPKDEHMFNGPQFHVDEPLMEEDHPSKIEASLPKPSTTIAQVLQGKTQPTLQSQVTRPQPVTPKQIVFPATPHSSNSPRQTEPSPRKPKQEAEKPKEKIHYHSFVPQSQRAISPSSTVQTLDPSGFPDVPRPHQPALSIPPPHTIVGIAESLKTKQDSNSLLADPTDQVRQSPQSVPSLVCTTLGIDPKGVLLSSIRDRMAVCLSQARHAKLVALVNSMTEDNATEKARQLTETVLKDSDFYEYFAIYIVYLRIAKEENHIHAYSLFVNATNSFAIRKQVEKESLMAAKVLLSTPLKGDKFAEADFRQEQLFDTVEKKQLKNLGEFIGDFMIRHNRPIPASQLNPKNLLYAAFQRNKLSVVLPFICNILKYAPQSVVFAKIQQPWLMSIMTVINELSRVNFKQQLMFVVDEFAAQMSPLISNSETSTTAEFLSHFPVVRSNLGKYPLLYSWQTTNDFIPSSLESAIKKHLVAYEHNVTLWLTILSRDPLQPLTQEDLQFLDAHDNKYSLPQDQSMSHGLPFDKRLTDLLNPDYPKDLTTTRLCVDKSQHSLLINLPTPIHKIRVPIPQQIFTTNIRLHLQSCTEEAMQTAYTNCFSYICEKTYRITFSVVLQLIFRDSAFSVWPDPHSFTRSAYLKEKMKAAMGGTEMTQQKSITPREIMTDLVMEEVEKVTALWAYSFATQYLFSRTSPLITNKLETFYPGLGEHKTNVKDFLINSMVDDYIYLMTDLVVHNVISRLEPFIQDQVKYRQHLQEQFGGVPESFRRDLELSMRKTNTFFDPSRGRLSQMTSIPSELVPLGARPFAFNDPTPRAPAFNASVAILPSSLNSMLHQELRQFLPTWPFSNTGRALHLNIIPMSILLAFHSPIVRDRFSLLPSLPKLTWTKPKMDLDCFPPLCPALPPIPSSKEPFRIKRSVYVLTLKKIIDLAVDKYTLWASHYQALLFRVLLCISAFACHLTDRLLVDREAKLPKTIPEGKVQGLVNELKQVIRQFHEERSTGLTDIQESPSLKQLREISIPSVVASSLYSKENLKHSADKLLKQIEIANNDLALLMTQFPKLIGRDLPQLTQNLCEHANTIFNDTVAQQYPDITPAPLAHPLFLESIQMMISELEHQVLVDCVKTVTDILFNGPPPYISIFHAPPSSSLSFILNTNMTWPWPNEIPLRMKPFQNVPYRPLSTAVVEYAQVDESDPTKLPYSIIPPDSIFPNIERLGQSNNQNEYHKLLADHVQTKFTNVFQETLELCENDDVSDPNFKDGKAMFQFIFTSFSKPVQRHEGEEDFIRRLRLLRFIPSFIRLPSQHVFEDNKSHTALRDMLRSPDANSPDDLSLILGTVPPSTEYFPYAARDIFFDHLFEVLEMFNSYHPHTTRICLENSVIASIVSPNFMTMMISPTIPPVCSTLTFPTHPTLGSQPPLDFWPPSLPTSIPRVVTLSLHSAYSTAFMNQQHLHQSFFLFSLFDKNYANAKTIFHVLTEIVRQAWRAAFYTKAVGDEEEINEVEYLVPPTHDGLIYNTPGDKSILGVFNRILLAHKEKSGTLRSIPFVIDKPSVTQLFERVSLNTETKTARVRPVAVVIVPEMTRHLIGLFDVLRSFLSLVIEDPRLKKGRPAAPDQPPRIIQPSVSPDPKFLSSLPLPPLPQPQEIVPSATLLGMAELFDLMSLIIADWKTISPFIRFTAIISTTSANPINDRGDISRVLAADTVELVEKGPFTAPQIQQCVAFHNLQKDHQQLLNQQFKESIALPVGSLIRQFDNILVRDFSILVRQGHSLVASHRTPIVTMKNNEIIATSDPLAFNRVRNYKQTYFIRDAIHADFTKRIRVHCERLQLQCKDQFRRLRMVQSKIDFEGFLQGFNNIVTLLHDPSTKMKEMDVIIPWVHSVKDTFFRIDALELSFVALTRFTIQRINFFSQETKIPGNTEEQKKESTNKLTLYLLAFMTIFRLILSLYITTALKTVPNRSYADTLSPEENYVVYICKVALSLFADMANSLTFVSPEQGMQESDTLSIIIPRVVSVISEEMRKCLCVEETMATRRITLELDFLAVSKGGEPLHFVKSAYRQAKIAIASDSINQQKDNNTHFHAPPSFEAFRADRLNLEVISLLKEFVMLFMTQHLHLFCQVISSVHLVCHLGLPSYITIDTNREKPQPALIQLYTDSVPWTVLMDILLRMIDQLRTIYTRVLEQICAANKIHPSQLTTQQKQAAFQEPILATFYKSLVWVVKILSDRSPEFICVQSPRLLSFIEFDPMGELRIIISNTPSCKEAIIPTRPLSSWDAEIIDHERAPRVKEGEEPKESDFRKIRDRTSLGFGCYVNVWYETVLRMHYKEQNQMDLIEHIHKLLQSKKGDILPFFTPDGLMNENRRALKDAIINTIKLPNVVGHFVTYIASYSARGYQHFLIHEAQAPPNEVLHTHILECPHALNSILFIYMLWEDPRIPQANPHILAALINLLTTPSALCTFASYTIFFLLLRGDVQTLFEQDTMISRDKPATMLYPQLPIQPHSEQNAQCIVEALVNKQHLTRPQNPYGLAAVIDTIITRTSAFDAPYFTDLRQNIPNPLQH
ncbi:putative CCR4-NOT transcription complex subunit 1 [Blattamonas nauphoetae]|uniref:CCR4-NOT transcription complex subunit 1 n=1 Tax=Blattamonas nauphoetae TaxID=2049346 RepID=A0ABQ9YHW5_9EUKA|nr:putative CCR4-NOT transcription complex subunit 1 [Blattamonas nauphoetae]